MASVVPTLPGPTRRLAAATAAAAFIFAARKGKKDPQLSWASNMSPPMCDYPTPPSPPPGVSLEDYRAAPPPLVHGPGEGGPLPLPPPHHLAHPPPLPPPLGRDAGGGSPRSTRSSSANTNSSVLSASPQRHDFPPLPLKPLSRSMSNPVISSTRHQQQQQPPQRQNNGSKGPLRKGKWTPEEEIYAHYIIDNFNKGFINLTRGTTLRSYLSDKLNW